MGVSRRALLALSESRWLRTRAPRWWFVKKAATRFMPGDTVDAALVAAHELQRQNIGVVLTQLGENVTDTTAANAVVRHYLDVLNRIGGSDLRCDLSVKLTQLGLDVDAEKCYANVRTLAERAGRHRTSVWIDMEQHAYVEKTLTLYQRLLSEFPNVGVCLQAYLYRTKEDIQSLLPLGGGIRLVKGAYREPPQIAYPKKRDVDASFMHLAEQMLARAGGANVPRLVFGTHDRRMLDAVTQHAARARLSRDAFEFHLLYGIERAQQVRLARDGYRVRVLISYGDEWFAWYMRRLAERPANVLFAMRAMFS